MLSIFGSVQGNIIGLVYFILFQTAGIVTVVSLYPSEKRRVHFLGGSVLGSVMLQWLPILFSFIFGFNKTSHRFALVFAIFLATGIAVYKLKGLKAANSFGKLNFATILSNKLILGLMFALVLFFAYLCYTHILQPEADGALHTGQSTYGDMSMHLGFITSLAAQDVFPPEYSIMTGEKLCYPFLCDSISSSIYIWGSSLRFAYILPMLVAFVQVLFAVYLFALDWLKSKAKATLAFILFFFNGGLGFIYFMDLSKDSSLSFGDIFNGFYTTPTNLTDNNIRWVNIIIDMLLPQRATLFGYSVLFVYIWLLYKAVFEKNYKLYPLCAVLAGALPMIHTHSFLAAALIGAAWMLVILCNGAGIFTKVKTPGKYMFGCFFVLMFVLSFVKQRFQNADCVASGSIFMVICFIGIGILTLFGIALLIYVLVVKKGNHKKETTYHFIFLLAIVSLSLWQLFYWTFNQVGNSGFNTGMFNWGNLGENYFWFYLKNWGVVFIILIPALLNLNRRMTAVGFGAAVIWFVLELIVFTPNPYDNNKLLYVVFLFLVCIAADYAVDLFGTFRNNRLPGTYFYAIVFILLSVVSALLSMGREAVSDYWAYSDTQIDVAEYLVRTTDPEDVFLTDERHLNEVTALAGRNIVNGSGVYLGPHGIYSAQRVEDVKKMFEEPALSKELFIQYNVKYVIISSYERSAYSLDEVYFMNNYDIVYISGDTIVFKVPEWDG